MARAVISQQLLTVEAELEGLASRLSELAMMLGDYADELHWDKVEPASQAVALELIRDSIPVLQRVEGLLHAYELMVIGRKYVA